MSRARQAARTHPSARAHHSARARRGALTATATAASGVSQIGPNQAFIGLVNGKHDDATIVVLCPGPANMGHPASGQTLAVHGGVDDLPGFTGSRAHRIVATLPTLTGSLSVVFSRYDTPAPIPTTLTLPCGGTAKVVFAPAPTSHTAISDRVIVTFQNPAEMREAAF